MDMSELGTPFMNGYVGCLEGLRLDNNPHPLGSQAYEQWRQGYLHAMEGGT